MREQLPAPLPETNGGDHRRREASFLSQNCHKGNARGSGTGTNDRDQSVPESELTEKSVTGWPLIVTPLMPAQYREWDTSNDALWPTHAPLGGTRQSHSEQRRHAELERNRAGEQPERIAC